MMPHIFAQVSSTTQTVAVVFAVAIIAVAAGSYDMIQCCNEGRQLFYNVGSCEGISAHMQEAQGRVHLRHGVEPMSCQRAGGICCLRTLIENQCSAGKQTATHQGSCPERPHSTPGGVVHKECCDCCMLARELSRSGNGCEAPDDFSFMCREAFMKCCETSAYFTYTNARMTITVMPPHMIQATTPSSWIDGGAKTRNSRCVGHHPCEQQCMDYGGPSVVCSCEAGYTLSADGHSCEDIDECLLVEGSGVSSGPCDQEEKRCVNRRGGYDCMPRDLSAVNLPTTASIACNTGFAPSNGLCLDVDECARGYHACDLSRQVCVNSPGSFSCECRSGYRVGHSADLCEDIDECMQLLDNCTDTQRCMNTVGSFRCLRTLSCGTGYILHSETEKCMDIDECARGTANCGSGYNCRNTEGSFRCDVKSCPFGQTLNAGTGMCTAIACPNGMTPGMNGNCEDIDECASPAQCQQYENCKNTVGSFYCEQRPNYCGEGYQLQRDTATCEDIDECSNRTNPCGVGQQCFNVPGGFRCQCSSGYEFNMRSKQCVDIDECTKSRGHICDLDATCENLPGSFRCSCSVGYRLSTNGRTCEDIDECTSGVAACEHRCINVPGSFQCTCERGFTPTADGRSCQDIDECTLWGTSGNKLCMGRCVNIPGSFRCECPTGYRISSDGRTCKDIDECAEGECQGGERICVNILGGHRCNTITCPENYIRDTQFGNRCNRVWSVCLRGDQKCLDTPISVSHNYIALPNNIRFQPFGIVSVPLFTMKGPRFVSTVVQFELTLVDAIPGTPGVQLATRNSFLLQKGDQHNSAVVSVREALEGPQEIQLELLLRVHHSGVYGGKALAKLYVYVSEHDR